MADIAVALQPKLVLPIHRSMKLVRDLICSRHIALTRFTALAIIIYS